MLTLYSCSKPLKLSLAEMKPLTIGSWRNQDLSPENHDPEKINQKVIIE